MSIRRFALAGVVALGLAATHAAGAQAPYRVALEPGTRVRVTTDGVPDRRVIGSVLALRDDTLALRGTDGQHRFPLTHLRSLEVRGGKDRRRGMLIGGGIAFGITAVFGGVDRANGQISTGGLTETLATNAVIGALVGWVFAPTGWEPIPLPYRGREAENSARDFR